MKVCNKEPITISDHHARVAEGSQQTTHSEHVNLVEQVDKLTNLVSTLIKTSASVAATTTNQPPQPSQNSYRPRYQKYKKKSHYSTSQQSPHHSTPPSLPAPQHNAIPPFFPYHAMPQQPFPSQSNYPQPSSNQGASSHSGQRRCTGCGGFCPERPKCPHFSTKCSFCGKRGHHHSVCLSAILSQSQ